MHQRTIVLLLEGSCNKTLSHYAGCILKKHGLNDDRAFEVFMEYVTKCDPPLVTHEILSEKKFIKLLEEKSW